MIIVKLLIILFLFLPCIAQAADPYWVDTSGGAANWAACQSAADPGAGSRCKLDGAQGANINAAAGDTIYLKEGTTYSTVQTKDVNKTGIIIPFNSGTSDNKITFTSAPGEQAVLSQASATGAVIHLHAVDYIRVVGINITETTGSFFNISYGSDYNEISYCEFSGATGSYSYGIISAIGSDGSVGASASHNWIHHNTIEKGGSIDSCSDNGTLVRTAANATDEATYNTIENNILAHGGHDVIDLGGRYNIVRNNVARNDESYFPIPELCACTNCPTSEYFGNRVLIITNYDGTGNTKYNLIEGNRFGYAGTPPDDDGSSGIENAGTLGILRYNFLYGNGGMGYYSKSQNSYFSNYNRVFNNTVYYNGYGDSDLSVKIGINMTNYTRGKTLHNEVTYLCIKDLGGAAVDGPEEPGVGANWEEYWEVGGTGGYSWTTYHAIAWVSEDKPYGNVFKNNIVYGNAAEHNITATNTYTSNLNTDPSFLDTTMTDKTSLTQPTLQIGSGSSAKDGGAALTTVHTDDTGSGTALVVTDALYFQDGTWGSSLSDIKPDWIAVGTVSNIVEIASINYATNTITIANTISRSDGDSVWLYKKSDGTRVLYGSAPDYGAHEYEAETETGSIRGVTASGVTIQ